MITSADTAYTSVSRSRRAIFRIYQELLTNILRHAEAEHVSVELYRRDTALVLAVEDDGKGCDPTVKS